MNLKFQPMLENDGKDSPLGNVMTISSLVANEFALVGYSLTDLDVQPALIANFAVYAGWNTPYTKENNLPTPLDESQIISFNDWAVLEPLVRAHCELLQAQRVDGTGSLGNERFGLSVSEATQNYNLAKETMKKEAYVEPPFTL